MLSYLLEGLTAQSIFERMIFLKKKTLKAVASTMVLTFGLSVVPLPALAVSTNIVAETQNKNTLTMSQIQDLAVIYNDTTQKLQLSMKQLDLGEQMARNQRHDVENSINSMGGSGMSNTAIAQAKVDEFLKSYTGTEDELENNVKYQLLLNDLKDAMIADQSMAAQAQSGLDSALAGIDQINDSLDQMKNNKDDLNKTMKDLETQMRYTAASLSLSVAQLEASIDLLEDQIALADKGVKIAELQGKLGMNISTDIEKQKAAKKEAEKTLEDTKETLSVVKRNINILIGRNAGNPLEVIPMNLPVAIDPAPAYTEALIDKFTDNNYKLKTLERDKADLKDSVDNDMGSDERQKIDYDVEAKNQEIKNQKQAISDDLKAMLAKINSDGDAYKVSRQKYVTEKKNFEYTQKRYELGMISEMQLHQAELALKQAELTNMQNGYQFYLDWQKYYAAEKGVDVGALN